MTFSLFDTFVFNVHHHTDRHVCLLWHTFSFRMERIANSIMFCLSVQYVRVMAKNAHCSEDGPFFPTTPRYIIQNGMSIEQGILKAPDWLLIGIMCVAVILTVLIIIIALVSYFLLVRFLLRVTTECDVMFALYIFKC